MFASSPVWEIVVDCRCWSHVRLCVCVCEQRNKTSEIITIHNVGDGHFMLFNWQTMCDRTGGSVFQSHQILCFLDTHKRISIVCMHVGSLGQQRFLHARENRCETTYYTHCTGIHHGHIYHLSIGRKMAKHHDVLNGWLKRPIHNTSEHNNASTLEMGK